MTAFGTPVLDNFNRANGALGADWTAVNGSPMTISSNTAIPQSNSGVWQSQWARAGFSALTDQEYFATVAAFNTGAWHVAVMARQAGATLNGYYCRIFNDGSMVLARVTANVENWFVTYQSGVTPGAGDKVGIRAVGTDIQGWFNHGGNWVMLGHVTDAGYASGTGAMLTGEANFGLAVDDFGGGVTSDVDTSQILVPGRPIASRFF